MDIHLAGKSVFWAQQHAQPLSRCQNLCFCAQNHARGAARVVGAAGSTPVANAGAAGSDNNDKLGSSNPLHQMPLFRHSCNQAADAGSKWRAFSFICAGPGNGARALAPWDRNAHLVCADGALGRARDARAHSRCRRRARARRSAPEVHLRGSTGARARAENERVAAIAGGRAMGLGWARPIGAERGQLHLRGAGQRRQNVCAVG